jgi:hypothetical protein
VTLLTLCSVTLIAVSPVLADTYRWVDKNGNVQYSDVMPPSQAGQGHAELDKSGRVVKQIQPAQVTAQELQKQQEEQARKLVIKRKMIEQRRRDKALLSTYTSETEIALARDRAIELENLNIRGLQTRMDRAAQKLADANTALTNARNAGKAAPASFKQMRDEAQRELAQISTSMTQRAKAIENLRKRFEEDEKRFLELKAATR